MRDLQICLDADAWSDVDIVMRQNRSAFASTAREDVMAFLARLAPGLEAARVRAADDGWEVPTDERTIWTSPSLHSGAVRIPASLGDG
jgi:hypothetical protein